MMTLGTDNDPFYKENEYIIAESKISASSAAIKLKNKAGNRYISGQITVWSTAYKCYQSSGWVRKEKNDEITTPDA